MQLFFGYKVTSGYASIAWQFKAVTLTSSVYTEMLENFCMLVIEDRIFSHFRSVETLLGRHAAEDLLPWFAPLMHTGFEHAEFAMPIDCHSTKWMSGEPPGGGLADDKLQRLPCSDVLSQL